MKQAAQSVTECCPAGEGKTATVLPAHSTHALLWALIIGLFINGPDMRVVNIM